MMTVRDLCLSSKIASARMTHRNLPIDCSWVNQTLPLVLDKVSDEVLPMHLDEGDPGAKKLTNTNENENLH